MVRRTSLCLYSITQSELGQSSSYQICSSEKKLNLARIVGLVDDYGRRISNESINYVCDCGYVPTKTTSGHHFRGGICTDMNLIILIVPRNVPSGNLTIENGHRTSEFSH